MIGMPHPDVASWRSDTEPETQRDREQKARLTRGEVEAVVIRVFQGGESSTNEGSEV